MRHLEAGHGLLDAVDHRGNELGMGVDNVQNLRTFRIDGFF